jgi:bleomycin hydrolase
MKIFRILLYSFALSLLISNAAVSQDKYKFTIEKELKTTSVKNQGYTGTCWSFATCSVLESEMFRKGLEESDLSEMYIVRCAYIEKAIIYVRMHGKSNFGQGGEAHDVINIMRKYGMVPQSAYSGTKDNEKYLNHDKLETDLRSYLDTLLKKNPDKMPADWIKPYEKILDKSMGKVPSSFEYKDKTYTPMTYMTDYLGINPDDFVEFTSFNHHPFYSKFFLEIPDNWSFNQYNNVPIDNIIEIIDSSISKGYTVGWGGDVSEEEFSSSQGIAIVPEKDWAHKSQDEKDRTLDVPEKELKVTQEIRQKEFDNYSTTDDHFMHITGIAKDQSGNKYYITKNSWGVKGSKDGYVYLSEEFVKLKTISLIVNKYTIPQKILDQNGIK